MKYIVAFIYDDHKAVGEDEMVNPEDFFQTVLDSVETDGDKKVIAAHLVDE